MIINRNLLREQKVISPYVTEKTILNGVSHGESLAGYDIRIKQGMTIESGDFKLASSLERFDIPVDLMAVLHDKSSLIRRGLVVGNTVLEPGWKGYLTLELFNHGSKAIELQAGQGIGQLIFHQLAMSAQYSGKYQNQADRPVEAINEKSNG